MKSGKKSTMLLKCPLLGSEENLSRSSQQNLSPISLVRTESDAILNQPLAKGIKEAPRVGDWREGHWNENQGTGTGRKRNAYWVVKQQSLP